MTKAEKAIRFIERGLVHSKGRFAGQHFTLADWQKQIVSALFGQLNPDGTRQYRTALIELPRKNGKTQIAAAFALYLLLADGEPGAEVYSAAADKDQARLVFGEAKRMLQASPVLADRAQVYRDAIFVPETQSVYRALSSDAPTKHGLNPHGVVVDELHAHQDRELWDVLTTAQGTRTQPLTVAITTAGYDRTSVCYDLHEYARKVRAGIVHDPTFYSVYYGAPDDADWTDRAVWRGANPALGDFLSEQFLETEFRQASELPARQNAFRQLYLNQWVSQSTRWIDLALWDENATHPIDEAACAGRTCYGGLDLASVSDLCAWVLEFPCGEDGAIDVLARFWVPDAQLETSPNRHLYRQWKDDGWLLTTPGNAIDYGFIVKQVVEDARRFNLVSLNIDSAFQGIQVGQQLMDHGIEVVAMNQTTQAYAAPTAECERRLKAHQIHHGGHPILRWNVDAAELTMDAEGRMKPDRKRAREHKTKIDGVMAMLMALDRVMRSEGPSVYETREVFVL
jgi:phage terminase large subunit-like protein